MGFFKQSTFKQSIYSNWYQTWEIHNGIIQIFRENTKENQNQNLKSSLLRKNQQRYCVSECPFTSLHSTPLTLLH